MKTISVVTFLMLTNLLVLAQNKEFDDLTKYYEKNSAPCGGIVALFKKKGGWKKESEEIVFPEKTFPSSQFSLLFSRLKSLFPLFKESIRDLGGMEAVWQPVIDGKVMVPNGPVPYKFTSRYPEYFCSNSEKIELQQEPHARATIFINQYSNRFFKEIDQWNINGDGKLITVYQMPDTIGMWKGCKLYEPKIIPGQPDRAIVIGHNGKMPWFTLSKKQYLTGYKNYLENQRKVQLEENELYIKKAEENIVAMQSSKSLSAEQKKNIVDKLQQQLKVYKEDIIKKKNEIIQKSYDENIKPVNEYLDTASVATLAEPAILDKKSFISFKGFFAKPGEAGIKLISFPSKYFNKQLPRYAPQFMIVYWQWGAHPANISFAKQFQENFPFEKLVDLLDK